MDRPRRLRMSHCPPHPPQYRSHLRRRQLCPDLYDDQVARPAKRMPSQHPELGKSGKSRTENTALTGLLGLAAGFGIGSGYAKGFFGLSGAEAPLPMTTS